eukprot:779955-Pleurochrysis_carterae.AAC.1
MRPNAHRSSSLSGLLPVTLSASCCLSFKLVMTACEHVSTSECLCAYGCLPIMHAYMPAFIKCVQSAVCMKLRVPSSRGPPAVIATIWLVNR